MSDHSRGADLAAVTSWLAFLTSHLVAATPLLQALALLAAIISGFAAAYYHLFKAPRK